MRPGTSKVLTMSAGAALTAFLVFFVLLSSSDDRHMVGPIEVILATVGAVFVFAFAYAICTVMFTWGPRK